MSLLLRGTCRDPTLHWVRVSRRISGSLPFHSLGMSEPPLTLADVEKFNKRGEGESRTPLMTVVQAVLAKAGGSMRLGELATQTRKYWNRPFPTSPYTEEELIYLLLRNSDSVRVS